jgi:valacyclovir hydrolase
MISDLRPLADALSSDFRVVAADNPGSGKSGPQPRRYEASYYREDAELFLAMLDALDASPAHLVGFSDGGEYQLLMAALRPDKVRSVAAWGAAGTMGEDLTFVGYLESLIDDPAPPMLGFSAYMRATYGLENARIMTQSAAAAFREIIVAGGDISRSRAKDIACPTLLITGEHDFITTPALVSDMANAIPNGRFLEAEGASHLVHHQNPEWLMQTIVDWLGDLRHPREPS